MKFADLLIPALEQREENTVISVKNAETGGWDGISAKKCLEDIKLAQIELGERGLKAGDCLLFCAPNSYRMVVLQCACMLNGVIAAFAYFGSSEQQIANVLADTGACALFKGGRIEEVAVLKSDIASDTALIFYSSGTEAEPHRIEISEEQACFTLAETRECMIDEIITNNIRYLHAVPITHSAGNNMMFSVLCTPGHNIALEPNVSELVSSCATFLPDYLIAVPRILNKLYAMLYSMPTGAAKGTLLHIFGGKLPAIWVATAPFNEKVNDYFQNLGLSALNTYGLSESYGAVCLNKLSKNKLGSVGIPLIRTEITTESDGELVITRRLKKGDWVIKTGDYGRIDDEGFIFITGRKKNTIITEGGKSLAPESIETALSQFPIIDEVIVIGDEKPYITAVISVNTLENAENAVQMAVDCVNETLSKPEQIKKFYITESFDQRTLTLTGKIRREYVQRIYAKQIEELYKVA